MGEIDFKDPYRGRYSGVGEGWQPILQDLDRKLRAAAPGFKYAQVKEKCGGLRVYLDFPENAPQQIRDQAHVLVIEAMRQADQTCEKCGKPGRLREDRAWVRTLCDQCDHQAEHAGG